MSLEHRGKSVVQNNTKKKLFQMNKCQTNYKRLSANFMNKKQKLSNIYLLWRFLGMVVKPTARYTHMVPIPETHLVFLALQHV
jgi:hypothetical protein